MKRQVIEQTDELRAEYDITQLLKGAVRGKYVERYQQGTNLVLLEPDVAMAFPTPEAVNKALRLVMKLSQIPSTKVRRSRKREVSVV